MSTVQEHPSTTVDGEPMAGPLLATAEASSQAATTSEQSGHNHRVAVSVPIVQQLFERWRRHPLARPCTSYVLSRVAVLFAALGAKWFAPKLHLLNALTAGWDG
jgi:hypothetical protein